MNSPELKVLHHRAAELQQVALEYPANDFASYRQQVGFYQGIMNAIELIEALYEEDELKEHR